MDNLSPAACTDMSSLIGALELDDHLESHGDGALESAANMALGGPRTYLSLVPCRVDPAC
jgi:hypothetical protein